MHLPTQVTNIKNFQHLAIHIIIDWRLLLLYAVPWEKSHATTISTTPHPLHKKHSPPSSFPVQRASPLPWYARTGGGRAYPHQERCHRTFIGSVFLCTSQWHPWSPELIPTTSRTMLPGCIFGLQMDKGSVADTDDTADAESESEGDCLTLGEGHLAHDAEPWLAWPILISAKITLPATSKWRQWET